MSVVEPRPNPETVATLLDTAWRLADGEARRTDVLDRNTASLATFASILVSIAALGVSTLTSVELPAPLALAVVAGLVGAIASLTAAGLVAAVALMPREHTTLSIRFVRSLPTLREICKPPERVRGEALQTLADVIIAERAMNDEKARRVQARAVPARCGTSPHRGGGAYTGSVDEHMSEPVPQIPTVDLDESPFESHGISRLPLDHEERELIKRFLAEYEARRATATSDESTRSESGTDLDESPFESYGISTLPLDKEERELVRRFLAEYAVQAKAKAKPGE